MRPRVQNDRLRQSGNPLPPCPDARKRDQPWLPQAARPCMIRLIPYLLDGAAGTIHPHIVADRVPADHS
jgi:hypothetical protein